MRCFRNLLGFIYICWVESKTNGWYGSVKRLIWQRLLCNWRQIACSCIHCQCPRRRCNQLLINNSKLFNHVEIKRVQVTNLNQFKGTYLCLKQLNKFMADMFVLFDAYFQFLYFNINKYIFHFNLHDGQPYILTR